VTWTFSYENLVQKLVCWSSNFNYAFWRRIANLLYNLIPEDCSCRYGKSHAAEYSKFLFTFKVLLQPLWLRAIRRCPFTQLFWNSPAEVHMDDPESIFTAMYRITKVASTGPDSGGMNYCCCCWKFWDEPLPNYCQWFAEGLAKEMTLQKSDGISRQHFSLLELRLQRPKCQLQRTSTPLDLCCQRFKRRSAG